MALSDTPYSLPICKNGNTRIFFFKVSRSGRCTFLAFRPFILFAHSGQRVDDNKISFPQSIQKFFLLSLEVFLPLKVSNYLSQLGHTHRRFSNLSSLLCPLI